MNPDYRPYGTWLLLAACILVYIKFGLSDPVDSYMSNYLDAGVASPGLVATGQWWRMLTANFVHFGFFHILMNGVGIYYLGPRLEFELGLTRYLVLFLVSGTVGLAFAMLFLPPDGLIAGASAGLFGMLGAYMALGIRHGLGAMNYFQSPSGRAMGSILLINLVFGLVVRNVSLTGHIGGFLVGLALCLYSFRLGRLPIRRAAALAAWIAFAGCVLYVVHPVNRTWFLGRQYWRADRQQQTTYEEALSLRMPAAYPAPFYLLRDFVESRRTGEAKFRVGGSEAAATRVLMEYWGIPETRAEAMAQARKDKDVQAIPADPWKP